MTSFNAGAARAVYELDASNFYQEIARIKREYAALRAASAQPAPALAPPAVAPNAAQAARAQAAAQNQAALASARAATAQAQAAISSQRLAQAQNATAISAQRQATAAAQTATALQRQATATAQAEAAQLRLAQAQARAARTPAGGGGGAPVLPRTIAGLSGGAAVAGGAAAAIAISAQAAQAAQDAGRYAISLNQTEAVLRQLSGTQQRYNTLTRIAAENQKLFGGSLAENYAPLTGVLALSNQTGASLEQLNSVTQLLLAKAPTKNAGDAFFGLGELLSGQGAEAALSLADQFNLPKAALAELAAEGVSAEDRLSGLTALLAEQGVSAETLAARLTDDALAYNRLGAAGEQSYIRIGEALARLGSGPASQAATGLEQINAALARAAGEGNAYSDQGAALAAAATSYDVYVASIAQGNAATNAAIQTGAPLLSLLNAIAPGLGAVASQAVRASASNQALTETQRAYAQALIAFGRDAGEAVRLAEAQAAGLQLVQDALEANDGALSSYQDRIAEAAASSEGNRATLVALADAYNTNRLSLEQFITALAAIEQGIVVNAAAQADLAPAVEQVTSALGLEEAAAKLAETALRDAGRAAAEAANEGANLDAQARAGAEALLGQGRAGAVAASQLAASAAEVDIATAAYYRLFAAQQATRDRGREGGLIGGSDTSGITQAQRDRLAAEEAARYQTQLQDRITERTGTTAQRLALVNAELAKARPLSEAAMDLQVEQAQLEQQLARERESAASSAASKAESAAKQAASKAKQLAAEQERLAEQEQRERERRAQQVADALERIEDRTADHYRRLRQAQEDYTLNASRREEDFQRERQRLLAEGRIAEANQLTEEFQREQRRAQEDEARQRARQNEDVQGDIARIRRDAELDPATRAAPTSPAALVDGARQAQAQAVLAATAGQQPALGGGPTVRIEFAPIQLIAEGRVLAEVCYPHIERRLVEDLTVISAVAPPTTNISGGSRP